jgi:roadblock/LC7 domain-containing protein
MSIYRQFKTDEKAEIDGKAFSYKPNDDKTVPTFFVARMGGANTKFGEVYAETWKPFRAEQEAGTVGEETKKANRLAVFVDGVLRGWKYVQDEDGNLIDFNRDNAIKLFAELPELLMDLEMKALQLETFLTHQTKVAAKN